MVLEHWVSDAELGFGLGLANQGSGPRGGGDLALSTQSSKVEVHIGLNELSTQGLEGWTSEQEDEASPGFELLNGYRACVCSRSASTTKKPASRTFRWTRGLGLGLGLG